MVTCDMSDISHLSIDVHQARSFKAKAKAVTKAKSTVPRPRPF